MEIVALVISIISLVAVFYQNFKTKVTLDNQIYSSFVANSLEIDRMLIEHPEVRKYVYDREPVDENTPDLDRMLSIMALIVDIMENIEVYRRYIPKNRRAGWMAFVADMKETPRYVYYQKKYGHWYEVEK